MSKGEIQLIGQATPEQIAEWKKKHLILFALKVGGHIGYIRKPTRPEISYAQTVAQTNPLKSNEVLLNAVWVGGSDEIKTNDELFFGVCNVLEGIVKVQEAELSNL